MAKRDPKKSASELAQRYRDIVSVAGRGGIKPVEVISTGSRLLNRALGVGGYPRKRITEISGPESGGKTTLAIHAAAETQRLGEVVAYIDPECALDLDYMRGLGVDPDGVLYSQPDTGEEVFDQFKILLREPSIGLLVVDSVAAMVPRSEFEAEEGDPEQPGTQARMLSRGLRAVNKHISSSNAAVIFINQVREKIGIYRGNNETTPGGRALKFYSTVRLDIRRRSLETVDKVKAKAASGSREIQSVGVRVKVVKNKVAPPLKTADLEIMFGTGLDSVGELLDLAVQLAVVEMKPGGHYYWNAEKIAHGRAATKVLISETRELRDAIEDEVKQASGGKL